MTCQQLNPQNNDYRFYGYKHWTLEESPRCFNVGKGLEKRSRSLRSRNKKHRHVTQKYGCRVEVCIGPVTNAEAIQWEIEMIVFEKTYHYDDPEGVGCNFTRGGEGTTGSHHNLGRKKPPFSIEHKQALKIARAKQNMTAHACAMRGKNKRKRPDLVIRNLARKGTQVRCSKCLQPGHNRRGCNEF